MILFTRSHGIYRSSPKLDSDSQDWRVNQWMDIITPSRFLRNNLVIILFESFNLLMQILFLFKSLFWLRDVDLWFPAHGDIFSWILPFEFSFLNYGWRVGHEISESLWWWSWSNIYYVSNSCDSCEFWCRYLLDPLCTDGTAHFPLVKR